ncbi:MAG: prepilin-type N-terminal cleavage/methylation domain-containing protein [Candidatus Brocadiales bacterium]|nr:prepilin-type N-terminal cleavage/methylation domain-containing protein [Candidatus Bathyanammoxibius amoris]
MNSRRKNGFTLLEIVIVLAIVGIMAGILVPTVRTYLGSAKTRRAEQDTKALGEALLAFNKDTARFPIYANGTLTSPSDTVFDVLITSDGDTPSGWSFSTSDTFENQLNENKPSGTGGGNAYSESGEFAWRGPYMGPIRQDPWGNQYVCNANKLLPNASNAVWVLSAGPNETIETTFSQGRDAPTVDGDDIAYRIK